LTYDLRGCGLNHNTRNWGVILWCPIILYAICCTWLYGSFRDPACDFHSL